MRVHSLATVTIAFAVVACSDPTMPVATSPMRPVNLISDGAHGGNSYFKFLQPMVANPSAGTNVAGLAPVVDICELNSDGACNSSLAHFTTDLSTTTTSQPGNSETVRMGSDHYIVNWHTAAFGLTVGGTYRVCVSAGGTALGHADVEVVGSAKSLKNVNTTDYVGLLDDGTLPIKFRIESGALDQPADEGCGGGVMPGTINGTVADDFGDVSGYTVYLLDLTGNEIARTVTNAKGAYTFTSSQFASGTQYVVCEANPWSDVNPAMEITPYSGATCNNTSLYAEFGYLVTAPGSTETGISGLAFVNSMPR